MSYLNSISRRPWLGLCLILLVLPLTAASCGQNDAPVQSRDKTGARLLNMPDHFSTIAIKCDGEGHMMYESDHGDDGSGRPGAVAVVADTEACPEGYTGAPR